MNDIGHLLVHLQQRLESKATSKTKNWWEKYLKQAIPFRGVKMGDIRSALHVWLKDEAIADRLSLDEQVALALSLMRQKHADDKLAGILYLQEVLLPAGGLDWPRDLPRFAVLFQDGYIFDWNTCDWFCVKVLGPLVERYGEPCAQAIAAWRQADNLWQRRAAGVAFVNLAKHGDNNFPGFVDLLLEVCAATVQSPERFAQTGTGWVLRELSLADPERVLNFVETYYACFSREGLRYALEKMPAETKAEFLKGKFVF